MPRRCYTTQRSECQFQSAPGREAGRCIGRLSTHGMVAQFQSAPGREAGRCMFVVSFLNKTTEVSIRARP